MGNSNDDPVLASVDAYNNDPLGYAEKYRSHRLHLPEKFASLLKPNSDILDIGCGPGRDLDYFAHCGHHVTGVELNSSFVAMCSQRHHIVEADIRDLSQHFSPDSFDGVWAQSSLVHLSQEESRKVIADCYALLRIGGIFYISVASQGVSGWKDEPDGRRWYTMWPGDSICQPLLDVGFTIIDISHGPYVEVWCQKFA